MDAILVTYASQGGSTAGVAEAIAEVLRAGGARVDVAPAEAVQDLRGYRAVVVGSAVHSGRWMPAAMDFLARNQAALRRLPVALFQVGLTLATGQERYRRLAPQWLEPARALIARPVAEASFAGALWPGRAARLSERLGLRIFLAAVHLQAGDYRDWAAIRSWAARLGESLCQPASP